MSKRTDVLFLTFSMVLVLGIVLFWREASLYFAKDHLGMSKQVKLEKSLALLQEQARSLSTDLERYRLASRLEGAPSPISGQRGLASLPKSEPQKDLPSEILWQEALLSFEKKNFKKAISQFEQLNTLYSYTKNHPQSLLLLAESYYQLGDLKSTVETYSNLIEIYPEQEVAGYALLRLGQIHKERGQTREALGLLAILKEEFAHKEELKKQAVLLEKSWVQ